MYYLETGQDKHTRFRNALLGALAVHAALILSVSFGAATQDSSYSPQIEVTLATRPSKAAPEDATHIARNNQQGSGDEAAINQLTSTMPLPVTASGEQQALSRRQQELTANRADTLTTTAVSRDTAETDRAEKDSAQEMLDGISPEVDRLNSELASLQAEFDEQTRIYADRPRVRRLTSASAKQSVDAAYLLDWRHRLEAVGNKYYPEASIRYGIYGSVRLLVVIRSDGSLEDINILSSSGYAVLDEAAIKVVRMAAPYSPFPAELKETTDKLEIIRTWHYEQNSLSSR